MEPKQVDQRIEKWLKDEEEKFIANTPKSTKLAHNVGDYTRHAIWQTPYPLYIKEAYGSKVIDIDGNQYLDLSNAWTVLALGHSDPDVLDAIHSQVDKGIVWAGNSELLVEWTNLVVDRIPSIDMVRFSTSGTEAIQTALRGARVYTGRNLIMKMDGSYHGSGDVAEYDPIVSPKSKGLSPHLDKEVVIGYFNGERTFQIMDELQDQLAAVIVEGVMGAAGIIPPENGFLNQLQERCRQYGIVFILDEVISFRLADAGAQEIYGLEPDITTLGKVVGGGMAVGAFGGRADIMSVFNPSKPNAVHHSGTFSGTPIAAAAGIAMLKKYQGETIIHLNEKGDQFAEDLKYLINEYNLPLTITHIGSLLNLHATDGPVKTVDDVRRGNQTVLQAIQLAMLNEGVFFPKRGMISISTAITNDDFDFALTAFETVFKKYSKVIE